jgi:hypothetical protein
MTLLQYSKTTKSQLIKSVSKELKHLRPNRSVLIKKLRSLFFIPKRIIEK